MLDTLTPVVEQDRPIVLPAARGPVSSALIAALLTDPGRPNRSSELTWTGGDEEGLDDEDLQLALFLAYELHYRGLEGVNEDWEWQPDLLAARAQWEHRLLAGLYAAAGIPAELAEPDASATTGRLFRMAEDDRGPSLSKFLMRDATAEQFREFLTHRSLYHLKEADPHTWAIPRLSGGVKAAMISIQSDEYGSGRLPAMHARLFAGLLADWNLDSGYGHYLDRVPALTLLATNVISLFGLRRRWRGALVGHLAMFEMTSSVPNGRYARGHRRLGGSEPAARFFDEHVVADSVHEQLAAYELAGGLVRQEPGLSGDVVFGARCAQLVDERFAAYAIPRWQQGQTTLRVAA